MNEWGIPDWQDAAAYGDTEQWNTRRWFWEFLRRRDDLRAEFDAKKDKVYARRIAHWKMDPTVSPNGVRTPDEPGFTVSTRLIYPEKIISELLPNPRISEQPIEALPSLYDTSLEQIGKEWLEIDDGFFRVDFDLDRPIKPQLEEAERELKAFQKMRAGKVIQKRRHPAKWLTYLRVLDGREAGASWSEIAQILTHTAATEQTARDIHEQARALCFNF